LIHSSGFGADNEVPVVHGLAVTVPGAAAAWCDTVEKFGSGMVGVDLTVERKYNFNKSMENTDRF